MSEPAPDDPPQGAEFIYDAAKKALDEQTAWIGDVDTKAGVLMGAVAVLFGLLFVQDSLLLEAPAWLSAMVAVALGLSALLSALAFHVSTWQTRVSTTFVTF
jgi:hypothetical protein